MSQTRLGSAIETAANIVIGYLINFAMNLVVLPVFFHMTISLAANFWMGMVYTVVSVIRSYCLRRWFNARLHLFAQRIAGARRSTRRPGHFGGG